MVQHPKPRCFRPRPTSRLVTSEGYLFIVLGILLTLLAARVFGGWTSLFFGLLTFYIVLFFRNPPRAVPEGDHLLVAPADGKILEVVEGEEPNYLKTKAKRLSIFMSPWNCHLNRSPVEGTVVGCFYKKGSFRAAFKKKAMEHNEHHAVLIKDPKGSHWLVVQIAGWLARRIVSYVQEGDQLKRGERFGLIQFGSRTDLYCPTQTEIFVSPGQKVYGGKSILGRVP